LEFLETLTKQQGSGGLNLLEILFERMPLGIAFLDINLVLQRFNPTWPALIEKYSPEKTPQVEPGFNLFDLEPGTKDALLPLLQRVLAGETIHEESLRIKFGEVESSWELYLIPLHNDEGQVSGIIYARNDVTARTQSIKNLEETVQTLQEREQLFEERTRQLSTLLDLSHDLASTIELQPQLGLILDQLKSVVDYAGASIFKLDGEMLTVVAYRGPIPQEEALAIRFPLAQAGANERVIRLRKTEIIPDVLGKSELAIEFRKTAGDDLTTKFSYLRSWMGVPLIVNDQVTGMLSLDHPDPDFYKETPHSKLALAFANQVAAAIENARLYSEARQRADETQTLYAVQQAIASRLVPKSVLQMIANEARRLTNTSLSSVYLLEGDELRIAVVSGEIDPTLVGFRLPVDKSVSGLALRNARPYLILEAQTDPRVYGDMIRRAGVQSFLTVPLMSQRGPVGTIMVADKNEGILGAEDERVLTMLASGAVVALENAHLYSEELERRKEAERRRQVAEGLRDILTILNSNRPLTETLEAIVSQAILLTGSDAGVIYRLDRKERSLAIEAHRNLPDRLIELDTYMAFPKSGLEAMREQHPYAIPDASGKQDESVQGNRLKDVESDWFSLMREDYLAYLGIPLVIRDEIYGSLGLYYAKRQEFNDEEIALAVAFADQAALAIENARLRRQTELTAVAAERSRLARDLHDAVTQTLFSASLIAEVLPRLWDRNPDEARRRLEELRQLTRGALAEMRTLLLELRPAALIEAEISELFRHLAEAFTSRARIPVEFTIEGDTELPADVKIALYRIAQEALNNIAKHASASQTTLNILCQPGVVCLIIQDDGTGFDMSSISPEHLGLGIMKERTEQIGASLSVETNLGEGTRVEVLWRQAGEILS
jgi:signal transduction histidine kinase/putative methionine-R-sulfoxide reductase with GAF domain